MGSPLVCGRHGNTLTGRRIDGWWATAFGRWRLDVTRASQTTPLGRARHGVLFGWRWEVTDW